MAREKGVAARSREGVKLTRTGSRGCAKKASVTTTCLFFRLEEVLAAALRRDRNAVLQ